MPMAMVPDEQKLVATYEGQPFALLGICSDETLDEAQKTIADRKIDWPCWFDGESGPIARDWNVLSWPTVYVLNQRGRIVAKPLSAPIKRIRVPCASSGSSDRGSDSK